MRKLAAIMFTDIVGYSALMSKDESFALQVLNKNREMHKALLKHHTGEFIKEIGDGTLSIFQSSWDAVNCAVAIQRSLAADSPYQLRIGIHIGDIVISDNDVFGDGVNIASRIESLCEPGGICFTERVYEDVQNKIEFAVTLIGEKTLKNISQPIILYSIAPAELHKPQPLQEDSEMDYVNGETAVNQKKITDRKRSRLIFIITSILILLLAGYFTLRPLMLKALIPPEPTPIAVISFENQTGDKSLDYLQKAIPNLLITSLEQSNLFHVMTWERMQDLLSQMGKKDVTTIDPAMGFEICRKEGINLIVIGSYVKAGDTFVTDVKVLDVNTKQLLKSVSSKGTGVGSILQSQIDYLSKEIASSPDITYRKPENEGLHVIDVTTNSMEAYDYFLKGRDACDKMYYDDSRKYLEEAVRLDSTFAVAWLYLSTAYGSLQNIQMQNKAIEKAYEYSSRATDKEQLTIKSVYARIIQKDPTEELRLLKELVDKSPKEKRVYFALGVWYGMNNKPDEAIDALKQALDLDPEYSEPLNQIAYQYMKKGEYTKALSYFRRYVALSPNDANPHDSMGDLLWQMGKLDDAMEEYKKALAIKPDFYISAGKIAYIYCMKENYDEADKWFSKAASLAPSPGTKAIWYWINGWIKYWCGNSSGAFASFEPAYKLAESQDIINTMTGIDWLSALIDRDLGKYKAARENFFKGLRLSLQNSIAPKNDSATFYVLYGSLFIVTERLDSAKWCLEKVKVLMKELKEPNVPQISYWYDCLNLELLLARKEYDSTIAYAKNSKSLNIPEFVFPQVLIYNLPFRHDFLARAYAGLGMTDEAIIEYEKLITFDPNESDRRMIYPLYHYYLGLLYEKKGQKDKAIGQYRKFLDIWKDTGNIYPQPGDARKRLESLLDR
jgi:adenylate cyclase